MALDLALPSCKRSFSSMAAKLKPTTGPKAGAAFTVTLPLSRQTPEAVELKQDASNNTQA